MASAHNKNRLAILAERLKDETGRTVETIAADLNDIEEESC
jgi:short-subunit dehydrogenase